MDEDEALAVAIANLKGSKAKALIPTARALRSLRDRYPSNAAVGKRVGVSREIVREFLSLLELPEAIQQLLTEKRLSLEHGKKFAQLNRRRPDLVPIVAHASTDLHAHEVRELVEVVLRDPDVPVNESLARLDASRSVHTREYHVVAILAEEEFRGLERAARRFNLAPHELTTKIVREGLAEHV